MPKVRFEGSILPTALNVSMTNHPVITLADVSSGLNMTVAIEISNSRIVLNCDVEQEITIERMREIYRRVSLISSMSINFMAFAQGRSLSVHLDKFIDENGDEKNLIIADKTVIGLATSFDPTGKDLLTLVNLFGNDPTSLLAMQDLIDSISRRDSSPINYARAIETIRNLVAGGVERREAWPVFRSRLNLSEEYTRLITRMSEGPRHGNYIATPNDDTRECMKRAWIIMDRYIEFRKRGDQPLPADEFPLL